mmetsp:Transcript_45020/g.105021  ORF Transcript_45020/g.105021 Transcript_45020/m.105021 type:complete len:119 (-) Transcript_45020:1871-2227(-)
MCFSLVLPAAELSLKDDCLLKSTGSGRSEELELVFPICWDCDIVREIRRFTTLAPELCETWAAWAAATLAGVSVDSVSFWQQALHSSGIPQFDAAFCNWRNMFGDKVAVASLTLSVYA